MIALNVADIKNFMHYLLRSDLFNNWEAKQIELVTFTKFNISCKLNKEFYLKDELEELTSDYVKWYMIKDTVTNLIKGKTTPSLMKLTLSIPLENISDIDTNQIDSLSLNINFENSKVTLISGTSLKIFTLDKTIDRYWDNYLQGYLNNNNILVEKI